MIKVLAIDHVVLRTENLDKMLYFYRDILNCPVERELPDLGLVQLRAGAGLIDLVPVDSELGRAGGGPPRSDGPNMDHVCLCISKVEESALSQFLTERGIEQSDFAERYGAQGHGRSVYINDPEGNVVELKFEIENSKN